MKSFRSAFALALAVATVASAVPPEVPSEVKAEPGEIVEITVKAKADFGYRLVSGDQKAKANFREVKSEVEGERVFWFNTKSSGEFAVVWWTTGEKSSAVTRIVAGDPVPIPPPKPVDPPAPPKPVDPDAPIKAEGLHVLVVYDAKTLSAWTEDAKGAIFAKSVRDYLRATCPQTAGNGGYGWQMWPDAIDASGAPKLWQDAYARPRKSLPWVVVSTGKTGFEGPLPGNAAEMLALLKKYGDK